MARKNGRDLRIKRGSTVIAVANTKTVTINNTPVDVTGDDDAGFVTLLSKPGTKQITVAISGFTDDTTLRDAAVQGTALLTAHTVEFLGSSGTADYTITGDFFMDSFSETGASDGALEFTANLLSSGAFSKGS